VFEAQRRGYFLLHMVPAGSSVKYTFAPFFILAVVVGSFMKTYSATRPKPLCRPKSQRAKRAFGKFGWLPMNVTKIREEVDMEARDEAVNVDTQTI